MIEREYAPDAKLTLLERILSLFFKHLDIKKDVPCFRCLGGDTTNSFFPCKACGGRGTLASVYLRRWYLYRSKGGCNVYIHEFFRSDDDEDPHDHPFNFWTFVLRGSYTDESYSVCTCQICREHEERVGPTRKRVSSLFGTRRAAEHLHQVKLDFGAKPVWTLVVTGPKIRAWGFVRPGGEWVPWRKYLGIEDRSYDPDYASNEEAE